MKKIIKLLPILLLVFAFSCEDDDSSNFRDNSQTGWVEFATSTSGTTVSPFAESLSIPVSLRVPVYPNGINVSYSLVPVQGDYSSIVTTESSIRFSPSETPGPESTPSVGSIELLFQNLDTVVDPIVFDVVLTATNVNGVTIGVDENSITSYRVSTPCPINTSANYNVDVIGPGGATPSHSVALVPVVGTNNQFNVASTWGPNFVAAATGNPAYEGQFLYPGLITINDDLSVTVSPTAATQAGDGGSGTYDTCNDVFLITMTQSLFTTDFTVELTMSAL